MARVLRFLKVLKNHPKKTIFFSALGSYGIHYANNRYEEEQLLRAYCTEASWYGDQHHLPTAVHRHITVLLNPAAAGGLGKDKSCIRKEICRVFPYLLSLRKCLAQFEKYCAPLLHLAGLKVAVVRTEHQGQARDLMAIMEKTDGVVLAGGDGTLSEALTGLLRRSDDAAARLPLSVLPLGSCSTAGRALWGIKESPQPRHLLEATMAVVRQVLSPMDVMEVQPIATSPEESPAKPIYASTLEWGAYRDAWERRDKYWYWASLRRYVTYLFSSYKDLSWDCSCKITYTRPCAGCSLCHVSPAIAAAQKDNSSVRTKRWYHYLLPNMGSMKRFSNQHDTSLPHTRAAEDRSSVSNPSCGEVHEETVERVCDVRVCTRNTEHTSRLQPHQLLFGTGASDTSATQFIREGWNRTHSGEPSNPRQELVGSITIVPSGDTKNKSGEEREFYVDGEGYEVRPCTIRARPNAVSIFAPPLATAA